MDINELLGKFRSDPAFADKYRNLTAVNEIQAQLKADGYNLSLDDIRAGINQLQGASGEMSEAELAGVAGGALRTEQVKKCPKCGCKQFSSYHHDKETTYTCVNCGFSYNDYHDDFFG